jgi:hypothetical protein
MGLTTLLFFFSSVMVKFYPSGVGYWVLLSHILIDLDDLIQSFADFGKK